MTGFAKNNGIINGKSFRRIDCKGDDMVNVPIGFMVATGTAGKKVLPALGAIISFESKDSPSKDGILGGFSDRDVIGRNTSSPVSVSFPSGSVFSRGRKLHSMFKAKGSALKEIRSIPYGYSEAVDMLMNAGFSITKFFRDFLHRQLFNKIFLRKDFLREKCFKHDWNALILTSCEKRIKMHQINMDVLTRGLIRWISTNVDNTEPAGTIA